LDGTSEVFSFLCICNVADIGAGTEEELPGPKKPEAPDRSGIENELEELDTPDC
jgi:hypothetical protein